ncbi:MAG: methyltransferase, partial [Prevotellaceae bacterium]|nr:methyltransferase [Prevotellaceae bacterium]
MNDNFQFRRFTIAQSRTAMKVGTDGVLLGAWAAIEALDHADAIDVLDVGTGTGLIALMVAQKAENARVTAIDIDADAVAQAQENVDASPWKERITLINMPLQDFTTDVRFSMILSNPPYFINSQKCPDRQRSLARHADSLPLQTLMKRATELLLPEGRLCIILPDEAVKESDRWAAVYGLFPLKRISIRTKTNKPVRRAILCYGMKPSGWVEETHAILL